MPSTTTYTSYEVLSFFQSVTRYGFSAPALQSISTALKQNEYIRDSTAFDASRFSTEALRGLYDQYISQQNDKRTTHTNGDLSAGERSPKRRKLSPFTQSGGEALLNEEHLLNEVIIKLYLKYRDETIREIKQDEEEFARLQNDIQQLERQIGADNERKPSNQSSHSALPQRESNNASDGQSDSNPAVTSQVSLGAESQHPRTMSPSQTVSANTTHVHISGPPTQGSKSPIPVEVIPPRNVVPSQAVRDSQTPNSVHSQHQSHGTFPRHIPPPSPQRHNYGPIPTPPVRTASPASSTHIMSQTAGAQQRQQSRGQPAIVQARASPTTYSNQHQYPPYQQYPPPQWHPQASHQPYPPSGPYGPATHFYPQPVGGRHPSTPQQIPFSPYPHSGAIQYMQQQQQQWRGQQWPFNPTSSITTPVSGPSGRLPVTGSGSSTPWKRAQPPSPSSVKSPPRPEREVSPLTDRDDSPIPDRKMSESKVGFTKKGVEGTPTQRQPRRRGQPRSITPSAADPSRSQSIMSRSSDLHNERQTTSRRSHKIKAEPPSTPLSVPFPDTEQRSSGRRGRPRSNTVVSQADAARKTVAKRKRDSVSPASPHYSPQPHMAISSHRINRPPDPSNVIVSKNFGKTSQLLLNEITSHKLASIFAKPLSERDAPGYKDLILRPQDLKSIKAAISKGGRAALAIIEAVEDNHGTTPTKAQSNLATPSGSGSLGNGFFLVPKTVDLVPPKGIVNSAHMEMELMRMFANAVMFNPLPSSERGFGRSMRLRKSGGDVYVNTDLEASSAVSEESESGSLAGVDEGGIIADAREMFNDVIELVGKWRELEMERMGAGPEITSSRNGSLAIPLVSVNESGRQPSVSASSNVGDDDTAAGESEAASTPIHIPTTGLGRKRRRIAELQH